MVANVFYHLDPLARHSTPILMLMVEEASHPIWSWDSKLTGPETSQIIESGKAQLRLAVRSVIDKK